MFFVFRRFMYFYIIILISKIYFRSFKIAILHIFYFIKGPVYVYEFVYNVINPVFVTNIVNAAAIISLFHIMTRYRAFCDFYTQIAVKGRSVFHDLV